MKLQLTGRKATVAQHVTTFAVVTVFMGLAVPAALAPYNYVVAPLGLLILLAGFYRVLPERQKKEYPKHVFAIAGMLAGTYIFMASMVAAPKQLISIPGVLAGLGMAMILGFGIWKDFVLDNADLQNFSVSVRERRT